MKITDDPDDFAAASEHRDRCTHGFVQRNIEGIQRSLINDEGVNRITFQPQPVLFRKVSAFNQINPHCRNIFLVTQQTRYDDSGPFLISGVH
jgi:hypothetical protein